MSDDGSLFETFFKSVVTIGAAVSGWFFNNLYGEMKTIRKDNKETSDELKNFKVHVSENYPKEITMARIHARLDEMVGKINEIQVSIAKNK